MLSKMEKVCACGGILTLVVSYDKKYCTDFLGEQVHMKRRCSQPEGTAGTPESGVKGRDLNLDRKQGGSKKDLGL